MLAPTDAALGKAVVSNPRVPQRIRQALNIESGLNDGIALPVFVIFLETAEAAEQSLSFAALVEELGLQVGIATAVGIGVGVGGARAIRWAIRRGVAEHHWLQLGVVGLAVAAYAVATPPGGSGFIAAWVAGFVFGRMSRAAGDGSEPLYEYSEATGDLLTMVSFLLFGVFLGPTLVALTWQIALYGVLSLVGFRVGAVAVAMARSGIAARSVLYLGWFGPRGLATIILTIEVVNASDFRGADTIRDAALFAVGLSVLAHGATAWWGSNAYAGYVEGHPEAGRLVEEAPTASVRVPRRSVQ